MTKQTALSLIFGLAGVAAACGGDASSLAGAGRGDSGGASGGGVSEGGSSVSDRTGAGDSTTSSSGGQGTRSSAGKGGQAGSGAVASGGTGTSDSTLSSPGGAGSPWLGGTQSSGGASTTGGPSPGGRTSGNGGAGASSRATGGTGGLGGSSGKGPGGTVADTNIWNLPKFSVAAGPHSADWKALGLAYQAPSWWRDAKLGAWSHWDPQSMPEQGDWYALPDRARHPERQLALRGRCGIHQRGDAGDHPDAEPGGLGRAPAPADGLPDHGAGRRTAHHQHHQPGPRSGRARRPRRQVDSPRDTRSNRTPECSAQPNATGKRTAVFQRKNGPCG